ncbi:MAG: glutamate-5-semialdehyde dehydrogenase [Alphaproteobacteria bacterium]
MTQHDPAQLAIGIVDKMGRAARKAAPRLARSARGQRDAALVACAAGLRARPSEILDANARDLEAAKARGRDAAFLDRLTLDEGRIMAMADGLEAIAALPDPIGREADSRTRPNGLELKRVAVPLGVVGVIFEARPNVTLDAGALCLKSGNAAILRCGSDSLYSARALMGFLSDGLRIAGLPVESVQLVPTSDRAAVGRMLAAHEHIDVIVPRGGKSLVARVQEEAKVPVFAHLDGICHTYIHKDADPDMAALVTTNAKMRRPSICGATETVLIHHDCASSTGKLTIAALLDAGCELRGDETAQALDDRVKPADQADWETEYLAPICAVRVVSSQGEAMDHINQHGSHHTDAIITSSDTAASLFHQRVDSAITLHNASTQFADGGEFGMGAEIGIATGRLHARGPVGLEELTCLKWVGSGPGLCRP